MKTYTFFKIKEGKLDVWKDWCITVNTLLRIHALKTMEYEHSSREYWVLFSLGEDHYVLGASEFFDEPRKADMTEMINIEHRKIIDECLTFVCKGESLCDLVVIK